MRIVVKVKPKARFERVQKNDEANFSVWVKEPPKNGEANQALIRVLADYFKISRQNIKILTGHSSKIKTVKIL